MSYSGRTFTWPLNPTQRDRQAGRQAFSRAPLLRVSSRPRSALVGRIQGPRSCKQKPDPVRTAWVSAPSYARWWHSIPPGFGNRAYLMPHKRPLSPALHNSAHLVPLQGALSLWVPVGGGGVKAGIRDRLTIPLRNPLTQMIEGCL